MDLHLRYDLFCFTKKKEALQSVYDEIAILDGMKQNFKWFWEDDKSAWNLFFKLKRWNVCQVIGSHVTFNLANKLN